MNRRWLKNILFAFACLGLAASLLCCSRQGSPPPKTSSELDPSGKSPQELARFVFANYGCNGCHTLTGQEKFGFTERGNQLRQNFEGCISLLTSMNVLVHVPEAQWTAEERRKHAHFQEYGCMFCHQVSPGRMGLTEMGKKLVSLHLSCGEVQRVLNQR